MNFVWCVVPSTIIACWFLFANRIGLLSCMTRRKYDIEWRSDHMSTGVSWWDENNSANLQSRPLELSLAGNTMGCHVSQSTHRLSIDGHFCQDPQWSKPQVLHSLLCLLFAISSDACPSVCCNAEERGEVYKCFFLCWGRLSRPSSLSLSSRTITSPASQLRVWPMQGQCWLSSSPLDSSKSWCFASFCFVGILTTFNFATAVCEQHPTTNYIGHKTKSWQQQWCQQQTTTMICRISHPHDAGITGTLRDISTFQLISI